MTTAAVGAPGSPRRYLHSLWLLSARDLKVRYSTSALGYLWSVLDPLVMSAIYQTEVRKAAIEAINAGVES